MCRKLRLFYEVTCFIGSPFLCPKGDLLIQVWLYSFYRNVGADPTMVDRKGNTPAHLAILYGVNSCLSVLVKYQRLNTAKNKPFPELDLKNFDGKN
jgi:predicted Co/Zn/Cd cation transporter (cation efflux family)